MIRIEEILDKVERYHPNADLDVVRRAYLLSAKMHRGQVRKSGEPYLSHPMEVANILADMRLDVTCITTGLLHDVVEDTHVTLGEIEKEFGPEIAHLVDGVTKVSQIEYASREERQADTVRKMLLAMVDDIRVVLVKLADRLHNMRTMEVMAPEKRAAKSQETLDIYAPIAHRLGMGKIRGELEDLSFKYMYPDEFRQLSAWIEERRPILERHLEEVKAQLRKLMTTAGIRLVDIQGRIKRLYSLFQKLKRQEIQIDQVYDLMAIRIITENMQDCYAALGVVHTTWKPVPGRFKDWIAIPRNNLYQSLHTTVVGEIGQPFEIQIRTAEMHKVAEEGIAAHWKYKEGKSGVTKDDEAYAWLKRLVEWQQEVSDSREFLDELKVNLYPQEVYAFTPRGKVLELPRGATPIDFAYAIHSDIGNACVGARINGSIVKLAYQLKNGDVVEILTSPNARPTRDWLKLVRTGRARNRIRKYLAEAERHRALEIGRKLLDREGDRFKVNARKVAGDAELQRIAPEYGLQRADDIIAAIGYGKLEARHVLAKLVPALTEPDPSRSPENGFTRVKDRIGKAVKKVLGQDYSGIRVHGAEDVMVFLARCCNPIRGEKIIGYITRGKGIAVHRATCVNAKNLMINRERIVDVEWLDDNSIQSSYAVSLSVVTENRVGVLADVIAAVADIKTDIRDAKASVADDGRGRIDITAEIHDLKHLERVMRAMRSVAGVQDVERRVETGSLV